MISGTYVLTDTIKAAFNTVFTEVYQNTDAVISGKSAIGTSNNNGNPALPSFPQSLLARVRHLPGVLEAEGGIDDQSRLVGRNGKVIASGLGPGLAFSVNPAGNQRFNPLELTSGRWPSAPDEIAIDKVDGGQEALRGRRHDRRDRARAGEDLPDRRPRQVRRPQLARRRDALDLRPADRAAAVRQGREARLDRRRLEAERHADGARLADPADPAADRAGPHRPGAGEAGSRRTRATS